MPEASGFELVQRMRQESVNCPVIFMSGFADKQHIIEALRLDAVDFLEKPFHIEALETAVQHVAQKSVPPAGPWVEVVNTALELASVLANRYIAAENRLEEAGIPWPKSPEEVAQLLEFVRRERTLTQRIKSMASGAT